MEFCLLEHHEDLAQRQELVQAHLLVAYLAIVVAFTILLGIHLAFLPHIVVTVQMRMGSGLPSYSHLRDDHTAIILPSIHNLEEAWTS